MTSQLIGGADRFLRRAIGADRVGQLATALGSWWRGRLIKPKFVALTGSAGKTTAKELLAVVLSSRLTGTFNPGTQNQMFDIAKTILRTRRSHDFSIVEVSENEPGVMDRQMHLLRPSVGIVTIVRDDHLTAFTSSDGAAQEMDKLVASLPADGLAILNGDDPRVLAMAALSKAKILTYGRSPAAMLRAEDVSANWPQRLSLTVVFGTRRIELQTQLCGNHWVPAVLGAIAGGMACGMSIDDCVSAIAQAPPTEARMQPVVLPNGVTFMRDDFKAPLWTLEGSLEFMKNAQATRKIVVLGELSDTMGKKGRAYDKAALQSQQVADLTIVVGPWAASALRAFARSSNDTFRIFSRVKEAAAFLQETAQDGDLILLKGTAQQDHLQRIYLHQLGEVACWRDNCNRFNFCNECPERMKGLPEPLAAEVKPTRGSSAEVEGLSNASAWASNVQFVVGLGNPGAQFDHTPHNAGYAAVDQIAVTMGSRWQDRPDAQVATGLWNGAPLCLVKVKAPMNLIGPALKRFADAAGAGAERFILVLDDLSLELGSVKGRMNGGAGGHRGVASVLEAFQTDAIRRIKIGVTPKGTPIDRLTFVLKPFDDRAWKALQSAGIQVDQRLSNLLREGAERSGV